MGLFAEWQPRYAEARRRHLPGRKQASLHPLMDASWAKRLNAASDEVRRRRGVRLSGAGNVTASPSSISTATTSAWWARRSGSLASHPSSGAPATATTPCRSATTARRAASAGPRTPPSTSSVAASPSLRRAWALKDGGQFPDKDKFWGPKEGRALRTIGQSLFYFGVIRSGRFGKEFLPTVWSAG